MGAGERQHYTEHGIRVLYVEVNTRSAGRKPLLLRVPPRIRELATSSVEPHNVQTSLVVMKDP
jgi:hypothetical protein